MSIEEEGLIRDGFTRVESFDEWFELLKDPNNICKQTGNTSWRYKAVGNKVGRFTDSGAFRSHIEPFEIRHLKKATHLTPYVKRVNPIWCE